MRQSDHLAVEPAASARPPSRARRQRDRTGLFSCEGEDLVEAALAAGLEPVHLLLDGSVPLRVSPAASSSSLASSRKSRRWAIRRERLLSFVVTIFLGLMHGLHLLSDWLSGRLPIPATSAR